MTALLCCFGPVMVQCVMVGAHFPEGLFLSWQPGSKARDRKKLESQDPLQGHIPNDLSSSH
jgi:hypothetical protein